LTHALYDLVAHPEYVKEMREEAETMIKAYGWTKNSMHRMRKIDSFLRESQRFTGLGSSKSKPTTEDLACTQFPFDSVNLIRKTLKDWTLSDGTHIPADSFIAIASDAMNKDEVRFSSRYSETDEQVN